MNLHKWRIRAEWDNNDDGALCRAVRWWWLIPPGETSVGYCCWTLNNAANLAWHITRGAVPTNALLPLPAAVRERTRRDRLRTRERIRVVDGAVVVVQ